MRTRGLIGVAIGLLLLPTAAEPHAFLVRSAPARRAALSQSPARVELWFNERLEPAYSSLIVSNAAGARMDLGDVTVGPDDFRRLTVSLPPLPPGRYVVHFRVLSVDGHVIEANFPFTVK